MNLSFEPRHVSVYNVLRKIHGEIYLSMFHSTIHRLTISLQNIIFLLTNSVSIRGSNVHHMKPRRMVTISITNGAMIRCMMTGKA